MYVCVSLCVSVCVCVNVCVCACVCECVHTHICLWECPQCVSEPGCLCPAPDDIPRRRVLAQGSTVSSATGGCSRPGAVWGRAQPSVLLHGHPSTRPRGPSREVPQTRVPQSSRHGGGVPGGPETSDSSVRPRARTQHQGWAPDEPWFSRKQRKHVQREDAAGNRHTETKGCGHGSQPPAHLGAAWAGPALPGSCGSWLPGLRSPPSLTHLRFHLSPPSAGRARG